MPEGDSTIVTPTMRDLKRIGLGIVTYTLILGGAIVFVKAVGTLVGLL